MQIKNQKNLLELFFEQYKLQNKNEVFLQPLRTDQKSFTWEETFKSIIKLSEEIKKINNNGDRCLLISENRPEWMISDLAIMLSGSITVPAYTTYIEKDYEYIIQDCTPKVLIISNKDQFSKVKNIINEKQKNNLLDKYSQYIKVKKINLNLEEIQNIDFNQIIKFIAMISPFSDIEKQALLETKNLSDFYKKLQSILELEIVEDNNSKTIN